MVTVRVTQHKPWAVLVILLPCPLSSLSSVSFFHSTKVLWRDPLLFSMNSPSAVVCPLPGNDSHISDYVKYISSLMPPQMHNIMSKMEFIFLKQADCLLTSKFCIKIISTGIFLLFTLNAMVSVVFWVVSCQLAWANHHLSHDCWGEKYISTSKQLISKRM